MQIYRNTGGKRQHILKETEKILIVSMQWAVREAMPVLND
jgi:hypothetical protein